MRDKCKTLSSFTLLKVDKLIVPGVAEVVVEPDPLFLVEEGFTSKGPALEVEEFLLVPIALKHDVALLADALDFGECALELKNPKVVESGEGDNEIKGFVFEGIRILRAVGEEVGLKIGMATRESVLGYVEADNLQGGFEELELVEKKRFSTADIQNARTGLEPVGFNEGLSDGFPTPCEIFVAAIAEPAITIPIVELIFLRFQHAGDLVVNHAGEDIALGGFMERCDEVAELGHGNKIEIGGWRGGKSLLIFTLTLSLRTIGHDARTVELLA